MENTNGNYEILIKCHVTIVHKEFTSQVQAVMPDSKRQVTGFIIQTIINHFKKRWRHVWGLLRHIQRHTHKKTLEIHQFHSLMILHSVSWPWNWDATRTMHRSLSLIRQHMSSWYTWKNQQTVAGTERCPPTSHSCRSLGMTRVRFRYDRTVEAWNSVL